MGTPQIASSGLQASVSNTLDGVLTAMTILSIYVQHECEAEERSFDNLWEGFTVLHNYIESELCSLRARINGGVQ